MILLKLVWIKLFVYICISYWPTFIPCCRRSHRILHLNVNSQPSYLFLLSTRLQQAGIRAKAFDRDFRNFKDLELAPGRFIVPVIQVLFVKHKVGAAWHGSSVRFFSVKFCIITVSPRLLRDHIDV